MPFRGRPRKRTASTKKQKEEDRQLLPNEHATEEAAVPIAVDKVVSSISQLSPSSISKRRKQPAHIAALEEDKFEKTVASASKKAKHNETVEESHPEVQQQPADMSALTLTSLVAKEVMAVDVVGNSDFCKLSLVEDNSFVVATAAAVAAHQEFAAACKVAKEHNKVATEETHKGLEEETHVAALVSNQQPLPTNRNLNGSTITPTTSNMTLRTSKKNKPTAKASSSTSATATTRWNQKYEELKAYHEKHGHINIPLRFAENQPLATWISQQREQLKSEVQEQKKKSSPTTQERILKLQQLGFQWTGFQEETSPSQSATAITSPTNSNKATSEDHDDEFQARLAELLAYKKEHGDLLVPPKYTPNMKLGAWVKHQKNQYKLYKEGNTSSSQLTPYRVKLLEDIGFLWPLPTKLDHKWNSRLQELKKFQQIHKHCRVPDKYPLNPQLATWVRHL